MTMTTTTAGAGRGSVQCLDLPPDLEIRARDQTRLKSVVDEPLAEFR